MDDDILDIYVRLRQRLPAPDDLFTSVIYQASRSQLNLIKRDLSLVNLHHVVRTTMPLLPPEDPPSNQLPYELCMAIHGRLCLFVAAS